MASKNEVQRFIAFLAPYAQAAERQYGVPASVFIAQAGEESGWGAHSPGNNLFGIKAGKSWKGDKQLLWTSEYVNGRKVRVQAWFRKYDNVADSIADRIKLMGKSIYEKARNVDPVTAAREIQNAGYATNPNYANSLLNHIRTYNLTQYDLKSGGKPLPPVSLPTFSDTDNASPSTPNVTTAGFNITDPTSWFGGFNLKDWLSKVFTGMRDILFIILAIIGVIAGFWIVAKGEELDK